MSVVQIGKWQYSQIQINGQRITTNETFKNCLKGLRDPAEVFIRRIPYTMYEDNLIPLFETIGIVLQFRLMMNYSGRNRGFGYIIYLNQNDGYRAITFLNNILVSSWCRLQLSISRNLRRLWLDNVSGEMDVNTVISLILEKIDPMEISICHHKGGIRFLLDFETHREAALSRKQLLREVWDFGPLARTNWDIGREVLSRG
ncbi:dead end protein homolog 1-like [Bradysia coprophila]|uniref:dead end protein homolog 1-like n=1 Tax=Bradysia coprophila TaxID=38358 RepID=UPI00187DBD64|nr:dead end protein homolog 1-like [Bradysia coprophila]